MNQSDNLKTPIGSIGKFGLIERISEKTTIVNKTTILSGGDDSAAIDAGKKLTLVSTDLLLEGIHFNLIYTPLKHLGYKAVIRGISDIYAMNGIPSQILIGLGISSRFSIENIEEIYEGVYMACEKYKVDLAGGDTTSSLTGLTLSITSVGTAEKGSLVKRSGAKPNDLICVTGDFGASYMGLQLLERERKLFEKDKILQPDLGGYEYVISRQLKPEIPITILENLKSESILPTSMIDVSDGLASDLLHLCKSSGTGSRIYYSKIPVDYETSKVAEEFEIDPMIPALNGGEDYEFLFTVPLEQFESVKMITGVKVIGHITSKESGNYLVGDDGSEIEIKAQGWGTQN